MRDTLASHGSRRPADGVGTGFPVGEQAGVRAGDLGESSSGFAVAQPFVLVTRPPQEMTVEAMKEVGQLGAVEAQRSRRAHLHHQHSTTHEASDLYIRTSLHARGTPQTAIMGRR